MWHHKHSQTIARQIGSECRWQIVEFFYQLQLYWRKYVRKYKILKMYNLPDLSGVCRRAHDHRRLFDGISNIFQAMPAPVLDNADQPCRLGCCCCSCWLCTFFLLTSATQAAVELLNNCCYCLLLLRLLLFLLLVVVVVVVVMIVTIRTICMSHLFWWLCMCCCWFCGACKTSA